MAILRAENLGYGIDSLDSTATQIANTTVKDVRDDIHACTDSGMTLSLVGDEPTIRAALRETGF